MGRLEYNRIYSNLQKLENNFCSPEVILYHHMSLLGMGKQESLSGKKEVPSGWVSLSLILSQRKWLGMACPRLGHGLLSENFCMMWITLFWTILSLLLLFIFFSPVNCSYVHLWSLPYVPPILLPPISGVRGVREWKCGFSRSTKLENTILKARQQCLLQNIVICIFSIIAKRGQV